MAHGWRMAHGIRRMIGRGTAIVGGVAILVMASLAGCSQQRVTEQPADISFSELAQRYNRNIAELDRLWARAVVQVRYRDESGRLRREQGSDSNLVVQLPDHLALSIGAVGQTFIWAGSDDQRYWVIDLTEDPIAWEGRHDQVLVHGQTGLPLQVSPAELPMLLGLLPLDPQQPAQVTMRAGRYIVHLPDQNVRLAVDSTSFMPVRVDRLDAAGDIMATSELSRPSQVRLADRPPGAWPRINSRIEITAPGEDFAMVLHLEDISDARSQQETAKARSFDRVFDYQRLLRANQVPLHRRHAIDQW